MLYFISGKDKFRRQNEIKALKENIFGKDLDINGFNYQELDKPEINDFSSAIQTPAFGTGKKVILVKDFKFLENKSDDKEVERISNSLKNKPDDNIVIFNSDKISGTLKLVKKIKKDYKDILKEEKFELFKSWDLKEASDWLCKLYSKLNEGKKLKMELAEFIAEQVGVEDSAKLYYELERLLTSGKELTIENLEKELDARHDVFKFIKCISQKQKQKAIQEFRKIVKARELNIGLLALMETTLSNSLKLKLAQNKFRNRNELAAFVGISPGRLYYQEQELKQVSVEHLNNCLSAVLKIERDFKSGRDQLERAISRDLLLN